jgi:hypothetical protein
VAEGWVGFLGPTSPGARATKLLAIQAFTGRVRSAGIGEWTRPPSSCDDNAAEFCVLTRYLTSTGSLAETPWRWNPATGRLRATPNPATSSYREIGDGLIDTSSGLGLLRNGQVLWTRPLPEIFGAGYGPDFGWATSLSDDGQTVTITVGHAWPDPVPTRYVEDLGTSTMTVGPATATGSVRWRRAGSSLNCNNAIDIASVDARTIHMRCIMTGRRVWTRLANGRYRSHDDHVSAIIERFDPATGRALWSYDDPDPAASLKSAHFPLRGDRTIAIGGTRAAVIDLASGNHRPVKAGEAFWCGTQTEFTQSPWSTDVYNPELRNARHGDGVAALCRADGAPVNATPTSPSPSQLTANFRKLAIASVASSVVAYNIS